MAKCARCGRKLPLLTFGEVSDLCRECGAVEATPQSTTDTPIVPAPPKPRVTVTHAIIAVNVLVLAAMAAAARSNALAILIAPSTDDLRHWGADFGPLTLGSQPWRVFTSLWLHIGVVHLLLNMWCLSVYGTIAETIYGKKTYLFLYITSGLGGSLGSLLVHPLGVSAGASGAIFGVVGALVSPYRRGRLNLDATALKKAGKSLLTFIGYNLLIGFAVPMINNAAHIGGLLAGLALGAILTRDAAERAGSRVSPRLAIACAILFAVSFLSIRHFRRWDLLPFQADRARLEGRTDEAISKARAAVAHSPNDPFALAVLGAALASKSDFAGAASALERAVQLRPDYERALRNLGSVYNQLGKWEQARNVLQRAIKLAPQDADAQVELAFALQGVGQETDALKAANTALGINPKLARAHYFLGVYHQAHNEPDQAIVSLQEASRLEPETLAFAKQLATSYEQKGLHSEAEAVRQRIAQLELAKKK